MEINKNLCLIDKGRYQDLLSSKIEKRASGINGTGLFANEPIEKGEIIWAPTTELMEKIHVSNLPTLPDDEQQDWIKHSYQIGDFLYKDTDDTRFMNHSCSPNVTDHHEVLIATRRIQRGEEITWDYLPYMNPYLIFDCLCGNQNCVGVVKKGVMVTPIP